MDNSFLTKIGFWYEKMPDNIKLYFSDIKAGTSKHIILDGQDELDYIDLISKFSPEINDYILKDFLQLFGEWAKFENDGKKVIKIVDKELREQLFNTDINKMTIDDLHLPFNKCFIELKLYFEQDIKPNEPLFIEGVFVEEFEDRIHICTLEKNQNIQIPSMTYFDIYKGISIIEQVYRITQEFKNMYQSQIKEVFYFPELERQDQSHINLIVKIFSILFFLDYAQREQKESVIDQNNWKQHQIKNTTNKQRKKKKINTKRVKAYHIFNLTVSKYDHNIKGNKTKQNKMALVRGHWRNQPYGTMENKYYRLKWIKPFWKNLDTTPDNLLHEYKVK